MASQPFTTPVADTVPKVGEEVAVGENLTFQRRWWVFERIIWSVFLVIILCDLLGLFGQGWLANAQARLSDGAMTVDYERIERASTPSTLTLDFGPAAIQGGRVQVYFSQSLVKELGAQRISPQPSVSAIGDQGYHYTFPATASPAQVQIQLQPASIGPHAVRIQLAHEPPLDLRVFVMP